MSYLYQDLGLMGATLALQSAQKRMTGLDVAKAGVGARALLAEEKKKRRRKKRRKKKKRRRPAITVRAYQAPTSVQREILKTAPKAIAVPAYRAPLSVQREIATEARPRGYQAPPSVQEEIAKEAKEPLPAFAETTPARAAPPSGGGGGGWGGGAPRGGAPSAPQYRAEPEPSLPLDPVFADEEKPFPWGIALLGGAVLLLVVMR